MSARMCRVMVPAVMWVLASPSLAASPSLKVDVAGLELLPQSLFGAALFVFEVRGEIDGRQQRGWGWVAANHEPLPVEQGETALITGGSGAIYVGLRTYAVNVNVGLLTLVDIKDPAIFDDAFSVVLDATITRARQSAPHAFEGVLDHEPFPPTIVGRLEPAP